MINKLKRNVSIFRHSCRMLMVFITAFHCLHQTVILFYSSLYVLCCMQHSPFITVSNTTIIFEVVWQMWGHAYFDQLITLCMQERWNDLEVALLVMYRFLFHIKKQYIRSSDVVNTFLHRPFLPLLISQFFNQTTFFDYNLFVPRLFDWNLMSFYNDF